MNADAQSSGRTRRRRRFLERPAVPLQRAAAAHAQLAGLQPAEPAAGPATPAAATAGAQRRRRRTQQRDSSGRFA